MKNTKVFLLLVVLLIAGSFTAYAGGAIDKIVDTIGGIGGAKEGAEDTGSGSGGTQPASPAATPAATPSTPSASGGGPITINGIPPSYNGQWVWVNAATNSDMVVSGHRTLDISGDFATYTFSQISNGSVTTPLWLATETASVFSGYTGSDTITVVAIAIMNQPTLTINKNVGVEEMSASIRTNIVGSNLFMDVKFSSGRVTLSWADGLSVPGM